MRTGEENCLARYLWRFRNQNGKHLKIPYESNILEIQAIFPIYMVAEWISSQSVFYQVLNAVQWWCLKKIFNGEIICNLKRRLKRLCYYKWKTWYTLLSSSHIKTFCISIISTSHPFERGTNKYCHWAWSIV